MNLIHSGQFTSQECTGSELGQLCVGYKEVGCAHSTVNGVKG